MEQAHPEYYLNDVTDMIYSPVGERGRKGFLIAYHGATEWEHVQPGTDRWDALHQAIYSIFRHGRVDPKKRGIELPPLPELTEEQTRYCSKAAIFMGQTFPAEDYPGIALFLQAAPGHELPVYVTLQEDLYESAQGDGTFRYFYEASIGGEPPFEGERTKGSHAYYVRNLRLRLAEGSLHFTAYELGVFDHHKPEQVLKYLELRSSL